MKAEIDTKLGKIVVAESGYANDEYPGVVIELRRKTPGFIHGDIRRFSGFK